MRRVPFCSSEEVHAAIELATEIVAGEGVVMIPTESFYGLGANPACVKAVERICAMKARPPDIGLPVVCADWQQVEALAIVPERFRVKLSRLWPAALSAVLAARRPLTSARYGTIAVRIPDHAPLRTLLYRAGPLTATSANRHRDPPSTTVDGALRSLAAPPDLVLDGGTTSGGEPSTLVDLTGSDARILRRGRVSWEERWPDPPEAAGCG